MAAAAAEGAAAPVAAAMRAVLARVRRAAERSGRAADAVRVVAVGKTKPVSLLQQLYDAGHRCFGENYVQEFITKAPQVSSRSNCICLCCGNGWLTDLLLFCRPSAASWRYPVAFRRALAEQQGQIACRYG
jgi:hypothetical protein